MIEKFRDISIIDFGDRLLTIACDSCGGVGLLDGDTVRTDGFNVGYHTAFVALAETMAIGAEPLLIADTLSVSLGSYGKSILYGIKSAAEEAGLDPKKSITGSSEENFIVQSTGIGVTVLGQLNKVDFKPKPSETLYDVIVIGTPLVGDEVIQRKSEILTLTAIKNLLRQNYVLDLVPVGSKGILYETNQMSETLGMNFHENTLTPGLIRKSAGPATCAVAAINTDQFKHIKELIDIPVSLIGTFRK